MTVSKGTLVVLLALTVLVAPTSSLEQSSGLREPRKVKHVEPSYPREALRNGDEGELLVEFRVNASGRVVEARTVLSGCPRLNDAAVKAVRQWRYEVLRSDGKPVPWIGRVRVPFRLPERFKSRAGQPGACPWVAAPTHPSLR
jgi:protein TonB